MPYYLNAFTGEFDYSVSVYEATEEQKGIVQLATNAEAIAGTNSSKVIVPTSLKAKLGSQTIHGLPIGASDSSAITWTAAPTNGQVLIGSTGVDPVLGVITGSNGIAVTNGAGTINAAGINATAGQIGVVQLATATEVKVGTDASKVLTPSTFSTYEADLKQTGFLSWAASGPYFDDTTLGTFQLLVGGTGYIKGKLITWVPQNYTGMTAGNTYYIYIDNTGTIGAATSHTNALYEDYIVLFECLRDSTPVTNNQITVRENHPYTFQVGASNYIHDCAGTVIENMNDGANIALNGTQGIQINGADVLNDHGLETTIPDSSAAAVTFVRMYTNGAGKWARQNATTTFTGFWNNAGTATALSANRYAIYTLYVSKDNLNSSTPVYFAVLNTAQYVSLAGANNAITNNTIARATNELASLELCQLGYIIYSEASASIVSVIISKTTLRSTTSTSGTSTASLINVNTTNFNGWLSAADTTVQAALDTLDNIIGKDGVAAAITIGNTTGATSFALNTGTGGFTLASGSGNIISATAAGVLTLLNDLDVTEGGTGVSTLTSHGVLMGNGASDIQATAEPSNGQLLIGKTGDFPQLGTLTAGSGVTITNGSGSVTISSAGGGISWNVITASQTIAPGNGYICATGGGSIVLALPAVSSVGDVFIVTLDGANEWTIDQAAGQQIRLGSIETTLGASGFLMSTAQGDTIECVCVEANNRWVVTSVIGNIQYQPSA